MSHFNTLIQGNKPVLVDFYADWCSPCKVMAPILKEFKKSMGDNLKILKIDVDHNQSVSQAYQIGSIPTLILFKNGKILWRKSGVVQIRELESVVKPHIS